MNATTSKSTLNLFDIKKKILVIINKLFLKCTLNISSSILKRLHQLFCSQPDPSRFLLSVWNFSHHIHTLAKRLK